MDQDTAKNVARFYGVQGDITAYLRNTFPYGHPSFIPLLIDLMDLHSKKNKDYAASDLGHSPLGNFTRVADILSNYPKLPTDDPRVVCLIYALKQLDQVLFSLSIKREGEIEGLEPRLRDIVVYSAICLLLNRDTGGVEGGN